MTYGECISSLIEATWRFTLVDGPDIEYQAWAPSKVKSSDPNPKGTIKKRRPRIDEIKPVHFPQTWGSTALGFGGIGGAAMTTAYTTVIYCPQTGRAYVYFGGRICYICDYDDMFRGFEANQSIPGIGDKGMKELKNVVRCQGN